MRLNTLLLCVLLCFFSQGYGQNDLGPDESYEARSFDEDKLNSIRENKDYQYGKEPVFDQTTEQEDAEPRQDGISASVWTYLMYTLVFVMLGVLAFFVWQKTIGVSRGKTIVDEVEFETEDIRKLNLKEMISQALAQKDYRLSVRLLYLSALKTLTDRGLIDWQANKTNQDYREELAATPLAKDFDLLTLQFDYIWYGNKDVEARHYDQVSAIFDQFQRKIRVGT